jgi:hypothetical protein
MQVFSFLVKPILQLTDLLELHSLIRKELSLIPLGKELDLRWRVPSSALPPRCPCPSPPFSRAQKPQRRPTGATVMVTLPHRLIAEIHLISSSSTRYRTFLTHRSPQFRSTLLMYSVRITAGHRRPPLSLIRRPRFVFAFVFSSLSIPAFSSPTLCS